MAEILALLTGAPNPTVQATGTALLCTEASASPWASDWYDKPDSNAYDYNPWSERFWDAASNVAIATPMGHIEPKPRPARQKQLVLMAADPRHVSPEAPQAERAPFDGLLGTQKGRTGVAAWARSLGSAGRGVLWAGVGAVALIVALCVGLFCRTHRRP